MFSAALRCGLIEAIVLVPLNKPQYRFPQHYAAASLKQAVLTTIVKYLLNSLWLAANTVIPVHV